MKMVTLAGAHACGKTAVILKTAGLLKAQGLVCGAVKSDCLYSDEEQAYTAAGIKHRKLLAGNVCPDHHFASALLDIFAWGREERLDVLFTESAGLCGRCAPHIRSVAAVCVIDCLSGISAPKKAGPMLRCADHIVVTKGDLVSPVEREVFLFHVQAANPRARISFINGLTGQGAWKLASFLLSQPDTEKLEGRHLRYTMPSAQCSFCAGQTVLTPSTPGGRIKDAYGEEALL